MAGRSLRFHFQDVRNFLDDGVYKSWRTVIEKIGTAYAIAYNKHKDNLPKHVPISSSVPGLVQDIGLPTVVAWLSWVGPKGATLVPIVQAINQGVKYLYKQPKDVRIEVPAVDLSPDEFKGSINHILDVAFIDVLSFLDNCIRYSDVSQNVELITTQEVWDLIGLSPLSYLPKNWKSWDVKDTAEEFERRLRVAWAKHVAHGQGAKVIGNYNYDNALDRLAILNRDFVKLAKMYSADEDRTSVNREFFLQILRWAVNYKPVKNFINPLPGAVVTEMRRLEKLPSDLNQFLLGIPLITGPKWPDVIR